MHGKWQKKQAFRCDSRVEAWIRQDSEIGA